VVNIADTVRITTYAENGNTGKWLIDPDYFIIGAGGTISGATLTAQLENTDFTAEASKDVIVNDAVSWSENTLTLTAGENVLVNNVLSASGTAALAINYGNDNSGATVKAKLDPVSGLPYGVVMKQGAIYPTTASFDGRIDLGSTVTEVKINDISYTVISDATGWDQLAATGTGNYVLGSDFQYATFQNKTIPSFSGDFNGFGHVLYYRNTTGSGGLFGEVTADAIVSNFGLSNYSTISGTTTLDSVGALANTNDGTLVNVVASNNVSIGNKYTGGLIGTNNGLIANSYTTSTTITVKEAGGGLVGLNTGTIIDSSVRGAISSASAVATSATSTWVGGFVGENQGTIIGSWTNNYISGAGGTNTYVGGFVGLNGEDAKLEQSFAYLDTSPYQSITAPTVSRFGGFVGKNQGEINNTYSFMVSLPTSSVIPRAMAGLTLAARLRRLK
jgi:hypothetical protein